MVEQDRLALGLPNEQSSMYQQLYQQSQFPADARMPRFLKKLPKRKLGPAAEQRGPAGDAADEDAAEQSTYSHPSPATPQDERLADLSDPSRMSQIKARVASSAKPIDIPIPPLSQHTSTLLPSDASASPFRFAQLPPSLLDDAYHHRQRAAQLILLCSQDAKVHKTPLLHRLSLSLTLSRPTHQDRPIVAPIHRTRSTNRHPHEKTSCDSACDGASARSDESDSDMLDLDVCRSSHLGNKKKRKSSRSTSLTTVTSLTPRVLETRAASSIRTASSRSASRPRPDTTEAANPPPHDDGNCSSRCCSWSLPRQSRSQKDMQRLRARIRTRLTHIILRRQKERAEAELEKLRAEQVSLQAQRLQEEAAQALLSQEKKPQKRLSKAEKRSQALRGSSHGPKAMSISAIRARAAGGAKPPSIAPQSEPKDEPVAVAAPPSPPSDIARTDTAPVSRQESATDSAELPTVPAPAAAFEFRMPSLATTSLRELRSQVDAAPKELTNSLFKGDLDELSHAMDDVSLEPDVNKEAPRSSFARKSTGSTRPPLDEHTPLASPSKPSTPAPLDTADSVRSPSRKPAIAPDGSASMAPPATQKPVKPSSASMPRKTETAHKHTHGKGCNHHSSASMGPYSPLFTADDWICVFCEYELYYGQPPLMLRACKSRKKLVAKKNRAKVKAKAALSGHAHHHHHDHSGLCAHHQHEFDAGLPPSPHDPLNDPASRSGPHTDTLGDRDQCDCGNSIHDSDVDSHA